MHTDHRAALGACPFFIFVFDEIYYADILDAV